MTPGTRNTDEGECRSRAFKTARARLVERLEARHRKFAGEECGGSEPGCAYRGGYHGCAREVLARNRSDDSGLEETGGDAIVAIELHIIEGSRDSIPSGRSGGCGAVQVSAGGPENGCGAPYAGDDEKFYPHLGAHGGGVWEKEGERPRGACGVGPR